MTSEARGKIRVDFFWKIQISCKNIFSKFQGGAGPVCPSLDPRLTHQGVYIIDIKSGLMHKQASRQNISLPKHSINIRVYTERNELKVKKKPVTLYSIGLKGRFGMPDPFFSREDVIFPKIYMHPTNILSPLFPLENEYAFWNLSSTLDT